MERFGTFSRLTLLLIFLKAGSIQAQSLFLDHFTASPQSGTIVLNWTLRPGNTCIGTRIFRGTDSLQLVDVGGIDGLCGDPGFSVTYLWRDSFPPLGQTIFYRLDFGGLGVSQIIQARVFDLRQGYRIVYEAAGINLVFDDAPGPSIAVRVMDLSGRTILSEMVSQGQMRIREGQFNSGVYLFVAEKADGQRISGKFFLR